MPVYFCFIFKKGDLNKSFKLNKYDLIQCKVYVLLKTTYIFVPVCIRWSDC